MKTSFYKQIVFDISRGDDIYNFIKLLLLRNNKVQDEIIVIIVIIIVNPKSKFLP
jgi:hypothetical protein